MFKNYDLVFRPYQKQFKDTFHTDLAKFIHPLAGFNIIKFDEFLETPDGKSTAEYIVEVYGLEAALFIRTLIHQN